MTQLLADVQIPTHFYSSSAQWMQECVLAGPGLRGQFCNIGPARLIGILLPNILILAGLIFFGLIVGGGFSLISGAGKEASAQDKAKAQAAVTYGVIGFLLVVSAYFILQVIGTMLGVDFLLPRNL